MLLALLLAAPPMVQTPFSVATDGQNLCGHALYSADFPAINLDIGPRGSYGQFTAEENTVR